MHSPNSVIGRHGAPVPLTERIHPDMSSSVARWHNITAVFSSSKAHLIFAQTFQGRAVLFLPLGQDTFPRHSLKSSFLGAWQDEVQPVTASLVSLLLFL